jgi:hypothetical protein
MYIKISAKDAIIRTNAVRERMEVLRYWGNKITEIIDNTLEGPDPVNYVSIDIPQLVLDDMLKELNDLGFSTHVTGQIKNSEYVTPEDSYEWDVEITW